MQTLVEKKTCESTIDWSHHQTFILDLQTLSDQGQKGQSLRSMSDSRGLTFLWHCTRTFKKKMRKEASSFLTFSAKVDEVGGKMISGKAEQAWKDCNLALRGLCADAVQHLFGSEKTQNKTQTY